MSRPIIEVTGLSKRYNLGAIGAGTIRQEFNQFMDRIRGRATATPTGEFWALRDVSFGVQPGAVVGILGRNGAGKSTLMKLLSRITEPTSGRAVLRGRVASLLEVGTGFHPELSGRENVFLNGAILGMTSAEIRSKFDEIVAFAEVEKFIDTPVKRYSSGMYVRLAFAVAAHLEPEILIVDEVLAVGDTDFQAKCMGKMNKIAKGEGRTVLLVSHNLASVGALATQCLWLERGQLRHAGEAQDTIARYLAQHSPTAVQTVDLREIKKAERAGFAIALTQLVINRNEPVRHGEPWEIALEFESRSATEGIAFGVGLNSAAGTRLASVESDILGEKFSVPAGARARAVLCMARCDLTPGPHSIDLYSRTRQLNWVDDLPACAQFEVRSGPTTPSSVEHEKHGGLRLVANWSCTT